MTTSASESSPDRRRDWLPTYVGAVTVAGLVVLASVIATGDFSDYASPAVWLLTALSVAGELRPIKVVRRGAEGEITFSTTFAFALLILAGPGPAVIALALASVIADVVHRKPLDKIGFNLGQYALSLTAAGAVLALATDVPRAGAVAYLPSDLPWILLAGATFFVLNSALVAGVISLVQGYSFRSYYTKDFVFQAFNAGMSLGLAPVIVLAVDFSLFSLPLLMLPLLAIYRDGQQALLIEHQSLHDSLTALPNRVLLHDRIDQAIRVARRDEAAVAVLLIDLDHFKEVNDTLGHHHGDLLLNEIGPRLAETLRESDTIARLGGDEFAVVLPSVADPAAGVAVARKMLHALERPFDVQGLKLQVGASIGLAFFPDHGTDVQTLIQRADIAMYVAKRAQTGCEVYSAEQDQHSPRRLTLASELHRAVERDEFVLHYQPKVDLRTGAVHGVEALVRWQHPERGLVMPSEFVPMAEQTGLIEPLTLSVLGGALKQVGTWALAGHTIEVAVNLSARSLLDRRLPGRIDELLRAHGIPAARLRLEITESMIMADPERATTVLTALHSMGVRLSIDDFGTGYSSLANLKTLPVSEIKIDRSFILGMATDRSDAVIVQSTIDMGRQLGLGVVAEGVETADVLEELTRLGCDVAQGFYLSRPVPGDQLSAWLRAAQPAPTTAAIVVRG